jgi:hypothetical protein
MPSKPAFMAMACTMAMLLGCQKISRKVGAMVPMQVALIQLPSLCNPNPALLRGGGQDREQHNSPSWGHTRAHFSLWVSFAQPPGYFCPLLRPGPGPKSQKFRNSWRLGALSGTRCKEAGDMISPLNIPIHASQALHLCVQGYPTLSMHAHEAYPSTP